MSAPSNNVRFALLLGAVAVALYLAYVVMQLLVRGT